MTARLTSAARWLLGPLFLSLPIYLAHEHARSLGDVVEMSLLFCPFLLAGLGVPFRVPAARGLAVGVALASAIVYGLDRGWALPVTALQWLVVAQALGLLLALPAFHADFGDRPRLRWTTAVLGFALPTAAFFAAIHGGVAKDLGWVAFGLLGVGVYGLARQRTFGLFALLGAAAVLAIAPFAVETHDGCSCLVPPPELGWAAAGALALAWIPWVGPVVRRLRRD